MEVKHMPVNVSADIIEGQHIPGLLDDLRSIKVHPGILFFLRASGDRVRQISYRAAGSPLHVAAPDGLPVPKLHLHIGTPGQKVRLVDQVRNDAHGRIPVTDGAVRLHVKSTL